MKIAQVIRHYNKKHGSSRVVTELCENFLRMGHEVHVYTHSWPKNSPKDIKFHWVPIFKLNFPFEVSSFTYFSTAFLKNTNYDVVNNHGDCRHKGIFTSHGSHTYFIHKILKKKGSSLDRYIMNLEEYIFGKGNYKKVIVVSELVKNQLIECFDLPEKDIEVIYNGINLDEFASNEDIRVETRKKFAIQKDEHVLLFVSNDFKNKGLDTLINSLGYIKDKKIKLLVVGKDREGTKPSKYQKIAGSIGVKDKIIFAGSAQKTQDFFNAADIFVLPTDIDSFGLVELEAIASGLPVVVSNPQMNGFAEIITDGTEGFILKNHKNPKEISEKVITLVNNPELRINMSENARKTAQNYTWDKVAKRTLGVYQSTL